MTVSPLCLDGFHKSRVVLLKKYTYEGFIFLYHYGKLKKGAAIADNPNICISIFLAHMERQIIIKGKAEKFAEKFIRWLLWNLGRDGS